QSHVSDFKAANRFQQLELLWLMMSGEKRLEDILAERIMGENGNQTISLLSKYAFQEMSFTRFELHLQAPNNNFANNLETAHIEKIRKLREEREKMNREERELNQREK
ncbi:hypothetical protein PENTCL1PPCAC_30430, partial [Pristionchus entomophagus]